MDSDNNSFSKSFLIYIYTDGKVSIVTHGNIDYIPEWFYGSRVVVYK